MTDQSLDPLRRMFDGRRRAAAAPIANQLQAIARILLRGALRTYPKELGLSFVHAAVIGGIGSFGPLSARDLATMLTMHEGQLSRAIKELEKNGWVERVADPADSRRKMLMLTRAGTQRHRAVIALQERREDRFLDGIPAADRAAFFQVLNQIRANAEADLAASDGPDA